MIKAIVRCEVCEKQLSEVTAQTAEQMLQFKLPSLLVACHATSPHGSHELSYKFEGMPKSMGEDLALRISCLHPPCAKAVTVMETACPPELVAALAIVFHTAHEGHPMELEYDGRSWRSPAPLSKNRGPKPWIVLDKDL